MLNFIKLEYRGYLLIIIIMRDKEFSISRRVIKINEIHCKQDL